MRRASIHDLKYIEEQAVAAGTWYFPKARIRADSVRGALKEILPQGKHYCSVGGGALVARVEPNPLGEKQVATIMLWVGSPLHMRALVRWVKSRPGICGIHAPFEPPGRVADFLGLLGFQRGQGGFYWWR